MWYRQPGESIQAYEAFMAYLTLPGDERKAGNAGKVVGKSLSMMKKWCQQWSWQLRVAAYEEHFLLLRLDSVEADRDQMWVEQKTMAETALNLVGLEFEKFLEQLSSEEGVSGIKPDALVRLFDTAAKIQRMAVLGRIAAAEEIKDRNEKVADLWADELAGLMRDVMHETDLTPEQQEKFKAVLERKLVGDAS